MKTLFKALLALGLVSAPAIVAGCGTACDDYKSELEDCCAKYKSPAREDCQNNVDQTDFDSVDEESCQKSADAFECFID